MDQKAFTSWSPWKSDGLKRMWKILITVVQKRQQTHIHNKSRGRGREFKTTNKDHI